ERYWNVPCITAAMQKPSCCSSNGGAPGPAEQTTLLARQPGAAGQYSRRESHAVTNSNFSQADTKGEGLDPSHPNAESPMSRFAHSLAGVLLANGPAQDRREKMGLYGWLIGDWTMEATIHRQ